MLKVECALSAEGQAGTMPTAFSQVEPLIQPTNRVRSILLAGGIAAERMDIKGYGESKPIADNDTPAGRAQNRRVEIVLVPTNQ